MARPKAGYYTQSGKRVPGVTTICSRFKDSGGLIHWAWEQGKEGDDYRASRDDAGAAGTLCHELIDAFIHKRDPEISSKDPKLQKLAEKGFEAFRSWFAQTRFELLRTEEPMVSEKHLFGGTRDSLGVLDGKLVLFDWKTSNRTYSDFIPQIAAYRALWEEHHPEEPIHAMHLVRVGKEFAEFHHSMWPREVMDLGWEAFLLMRRLYDLDKSLKRAVGS